MNRFFHLTLNDQRKRDISTVLHFFLWLTRRSDIDLHDYESSLKEVIDLFNKIEQAASDTKIKVSLHEFLIVYAAAQYLQKGMNSLAGKEYIMDLLGVNNQPDWFEKQKKYFINVSTFLIKECNTKFDDLPDYARERMRLDEQIELFELPPIKKGA